MGPTESWRHERLTVVTLLPFRNAEVVVGTASHHCFGTDNEVSGPPLDGLPVRQQAEATHTNLGLPTRLLRNDLGTLVAVRAHFPYVAFPALSLRLPLSAESRSSPERTASSRRWESRTSARNEDSPARRQMRVSSHTIAMPNALAQDG